MATILLIDDSPVQVRTREAVLRTAGFDAHIATTVQSALAVLRSPVAQRLSAVITDHVLEEGSGLDFVRELRRVDPQIPVIVVTGSAEAEADYKDLDVIFRQKPCPPEELISLVRSAIRAA